MTTSNIIAGVTATALALSLAVGVGAMAAPPSEPPSICEYQNGLFCEPCPTCPQENSGWLCCTPRGVCVSSTVDGDCSDPNIHGYCDNFSVDAVGQATCHDTL